MRIAISVPNVEILRGGIGSFKLLKLLDIPDMRLLEWGRWMKVRERIVIRRTES